MRTIQPGSICGPFSCRAAQRVHVLCSDAHDLVGHNGAARALAQAVAAGRLVVIVAVVRLRLPVRVAEHVLCRYVRGGGGGVEEEKKKEKMIWCLSWWVWG